MRPIDGDKLMMHLTDWWYSSFGQSATDESKAIKTVLDKIEQSLGVFAMEKQEADRWIPVTERLPEDGERVLITYWENVIQATWDEMRGCFLNTNAVLLDIELIHAWSPLPEPYTEEDNDQ